MIPVVKLGFHKTHFKLSSVNSALFEGVKCGYAHARDACLRKTGERDRRQWNIMQDAGGSVGEVFLYQILCRNTPSLIYFDSGPFFFLLSEALRMSFFVDFPSGEALGDLH